MAQELDLFVQTVPFNPVFDKAADTTYGLQLRDSSQKIIDLTGYTAKLSIYPFRKAPDTYDVLSTNENDGRIRPLDDTGVVWITFPADKTKDYKWTHGWYKLEITSAGGYVYRIADGEIFMRE